MSVSLSLASVAVELGWTQISPNTGFVTSRQGPDKLSASLSPDLTVVNRVYAVSGTLAASGTVTIDLQALTTYLTGADAVVLTKVQAVMLTATTTGMKFEPGATNPATWFFSGTTPAITLQAGGFFCLGDGSVYTVTASLKTLKITNISASLTGTYAIAILGGT